jgi:hypothetical protein
VYFDDLDFRDRFLGARVRELLTLTANSSRRTCQKNQGPTVNPGGLASLKKRRAKTAFYFQLFLDPTAQRPANQA